MENAVNEIIIKSGNGNKSINSYIDQISTKLINDLTVTIKAYDNNMNKLITLEQIIKRGVNSDNKKNIAINYHIGNEVIDEKKIPYIRCEIKITKKDVEKIKILIGNKNNKRKSNIVEKSKDEEDMDDDNGDKKKYTNKNKRQKIEELKQENNSINDLCIQNINQFFK